MLKYVGSSAARLTATLSMAPGHLEAFVFEWGSTNTAWHNAVHLGVRFFYMCTPKLIMEVKTAGATNLLWSGGNWQSGWSSYNKLVTHFIWIRSKDAGLKGSTCSDHHKTTGSCPTPFNSKCQLWLISLWGFHVKYSRAVHYHMLLSSRYFYNSIFLFPYHAISHDIARCGCYCIGVIARAPGLRSILATTMCFN